MVKMRSHINEVQTFNMVSIRKNVATAEYCRTGVSALGGVTAGILGLTGLFGFAFYVACALSLYVGLMLKAGVGSSKKYFLSKRGLLMNGQFGALFTYILFWTFLYGMVHVY